MTENAQPQRHFAIQRLFVKDASFESPSVPAVFQEAWKPEIDIQLGTQNRRLAEGVHEVILSVTATAKLGDKTAFLVEVQQGGIFALSGFPEEEAAQVLGAYCPNTLFPFAREAIADLTGKGGFPPLLLGPVNFEALYAQHLEEKSRAADSAAPAKH